LAISPPSDIVLDVVRAAEPEAVAQARAKLASARAANAPDGAGFAPLAHVRGGVAFGRAAAAGAADDPQRGAYVKFEAMVLQNFLQSMLPSENKSVYGQGLSGEMWRSLLAEQLSGVMAERGGIGIAQRMLAGRYKEGEKTVSIGAIPQAAHRQELDSREMLSTAMVHEVQRRISQSIFDGAKTGDKAGK
jgi:Rod binding domain-containing protein